ncbi:MAG: TonB C-terminal domain-containing protein [Candidatus Aminicenantes bacterium]|nr:TonB C-terminal domain-containing protein [Candidatus Aminicenantes bacterium]
MAIFAVSLVLHAFLVYGLYHARLTVKVFPVWSAVRDVLLVPPVKLVLPEPIEKYIQNYPSSDQSFGPGIYRDRPGPAKKSGRPEGNAANRPEPGPASGLAPENLMKDQSGAPPSSAPSLSGELALGSRYKEEEDGKLRINLSAIPDHVVEAPLGFENGKEGRRSFMRYVRPNRFGTGAGTESGASRGVGTGSGSQRAAATFQSPGYDISPWAQKVIDLVQFNWKIPDIRNILEKSEVRISVTIEKNGTFSAFEIAGGVNLGVFNAAAANALRSSSPLPPLPDDFPASNLNALFVFKYHE